MDEKKIHSIIDEAMAARDRSVSIYISPDGGVSVSIFPWPDEETLRNMRASGLISHNDYRTRLGLSPMKAKRALCMLAAILLVVAMMLMFLTGCNRQVIDTTFSYDKAVLALPDGSVVSGKIESWKDYDDGDQIQVKIDGTTYLVHSANIALIKE